MNEPKIVIEPKTYRGWDLEHSPSHDGKADFRARKDGMHVFAPSLQELINGITVAEHRTVRLVRPVAILHKDEYSHGQWKSATVTVVDRGMFYFRMENGEVHSESFEDLDKALNSGRRGRLSYIMDTAENRKKIAKAARMRARAERITEEADVLLKSMEPLTPADVKMGLPQ